MVTQRVVKLCVRFAIVAHRAMGLLLRGLCEVRHSYPEGCGRWAIVTQMVVGS